MPATQRHSHTTGSPSPQLQLASPPWGTGERARLRGRGWLLEIWAELPDKESEVNLNSGSRGLWSANEDRLIWGKTLKASVFVGNM